MYAQLSLIPVFLYTPHSPPATRPLSSHTVTPRSVQFVSCFFLLGAKDARPRPHGQRVSILTTTTTTRDIAYVSASASAWGGAAAMASTASLIRSSALSFVGEPRPARVWAGRRKGEPGAAADKKEGGRRGKRRRSGEGRPVSCLTATCSSLLQSKARLLGEDFAAVEKGGRRAG